MGFGVYKQDCRQQQENQINIKTTKTRTYLSIILNKFFQFILYINRNKLFWKKY